MMHKILKSYARNISTLANNTTICDDCDIDRRTLDNYLELLRKLYIVEELEP
ncbi:MAG: hypothetical protein MJ201_05525 [Mycoplasmoidaceae bacterium]|nr:hypothetical protein [Mycoplasmoidaceae bacterium]